MRWRIGLAEHAGVHAFVLVWATGRSVRGVVRVLGARASPRGGRAWLWLQEDCHGGAPAVEHRRWCSRSCSGLRVLGSSAKEWEGVAGAH